MKRYLIRLLKEDLSAAKNRLSGAIKMTERTSDDYWKRRKQSYENKIIKLEKYLKRLDEMDFSVFSIFK